MKRPALPALATASGMILFALPAAARADGPCLAGTYGPQTVLSGQDLELCGAHVKGSVNVHAGGTFGATGSHIDGSVVALGEQSLTLCGNRIDGSVSSRKSNGLVLIGEDDPNCTPNAIGGAVTVVGNRNGLTVSGNRIRGSLDIERNFGSDVFTFEPEAGDNFVFGAIICHDNGAAPFLGVYTDGGPDRALGAVLGDCVTEDTTK